MAVVAGATRYRRPDQEADRGQRLLLRDIDWQTYRTISTALTGRHLRFSYDRRSFEFMTISTERARFARLLGRLVAVLTEELDLPIASCGDMTCEREDLERAVEADECYYIENEPAIRGKKQIDLNRDPPPDLAIEVDISRSSAHRVGIHATLGISEVWRFDGKCLEFLGRNASGGYDAIERSLLFPIMTSNDLLRFVRRRGKIDDNAIVRSFRTWVRSEVTKQAPKKPKNKK